MSAPSVAIVILNWNGRSYLEQFLPPVLATTYERYEVIVADNASTDESVHFLAENYPQVRIIFLEKNFGFARGYNEALKHVNADYYLLLNSDVEVTPGWLDPMVALLEQSPDHLACQPKVLSYRDRTRFEYAGAAGGWIDKYGYPFARGRVFDLCEEDEGQFDTVQEIFWASGAAMLVRASAYNRLHGFDEYFFAHQEEIDLCWRMQRAGGKVFCCPQSIVYHVGGGTLPKGNSRKTFLNFRNNQIMLWKNLPWREKWWKISFRLLLDQVSALKGLLSGDAGYFAAIFRAHWAFLYWRIFHPKEKSTLPKKRMKQLAGVYPGNIVWQHFVKKKKRFGEIVGLRG